MYIHTYMHMYNTYIYIYTYNANLATQILRCKLYILFLFNHKSLFLVMPTRDANGIGLSQIVLSCDANCICSNHRYCDADWE